MGISLYDFFQNIVSKDCGKTKNPANNLAQIFRICFYHDLGYIYSLDLKGKNCKLNHTLKNCFSDLNVEDIKTIKRYFCLKDGFNDEDLEDVLRNQKAEELWSQDFILQERNNLLSMCDIRGFNSIKNHAIGSAILLERFINIKKLLFMPKVDEKQMLVVTSKDEYAEEYENFRDVLQAIAMHNFNMVHTIDFNNYFWACFLMIVDELQNYGRPYQDKTKNVSLILPMDVDLDILDGKITYKEEGNVYNDRIVKKLEGKMEQDLLRGIF